jgi:peptide/nickel transport system permease protein
MSELAADPALPPGTLTPNLGESTSEARRETLNQILHSKTVWIGSIILLFWVFCAIFGYKIVPYDPFETHTLDKHKPPTGEHWFGTDNLGRDVFSRVIVGARAILVIAPIATIIATILGTSLGLIMGYFRGWVDDILSRLLEAILSLPLVVVSLVVLAAVGTSDVTVIVVIGLVFTAPIARTVRAAVLTESDLDYVTAAQLRGERAPFILFREILPNVTAPILVEFTIRIGYAVFTIATLAFLGFGPAPPSPDWGAQLQEAYPYISAGYWWESLFPAIAVASLVVAINLISDGLRQVQDA